MNKMNCFINISKELASYSFLPTGDIFAFTYDNFMINQFRGNMKDGSMNNIYLRIYQNGSLCSYPLLGIASKSQVFCNDETIIYRGCIQDISYQITFRPEKQIWFWDIKLEGTEKEIDLVYGQDIGIANSGAVLTNELYMSQYLGHSVYDGPNGYIICSRQNMPNSDCFPYLQQGVIGARAIHYSTDGLQFFGLSYKENNAPAVLSSDLQDYNLQYEFSYTALQTEQLQLNGTCNLSFYGLFQPSHPEAIREAEYQELVTEAYQRPLASTDRCSPLECIQIKSEFGAPYSSPSFMLEEIRSFFPERLLEEYEADQLLSFFTPDHAHIVTKDKELLTQRPHGTIINTPVNQEQLDQNLIASTQYMYGIFNSHVVIGNTDLHKFLSTPRGFLNILKNSGQRIYIRLEGTYHLLTLPALYEMGMNYSRWFYKLPDDILIITAYATVQETRIVLEAASQKNHSYDFIVTNQITMGSNEYNQDIRCTEITDGLRFTLDSEKYPGLHYDLILPGQSFEIKNDCIFFENAKSYDESFLTIAIEEAKTFQLVIKGYLDGTEELEKNEANHSEDSIDDRTEKQENTKIELYNFKQEKETVLKSFESLINHFHLDLDGDDNRELKILNETIWWYTHNAMIHYAMPHGLEQPGGAAWGTRDVCQGPMEFFLTTQNYTLMRQILLNVFSHQNYETKEWPQWFMFDRYSINAGECHGDVVFWPLKSIADYILASGDNDILTELLPYDGAPEQAEPLHQHIRGALDNIRNTRFISDTGLITYAGGDWDDTLQPASDELKEKLVSSWTVALAYQTFTLLAEALSCFDSALSTEIVHLSDLIKKSFDQILVKDGIISGFLECSDSYRYILHPSDNSTGIHYRLIPMTRSIIAELVDQEQAKKNIEIIQTKLKCPDGVRLMDRPAHYDGGVSHLFKRAEQASNVGREISLQYTHAHIRYIEAMAKLGQSTEAWSSLFTINPILIKQHVPNANIRQSNLYFSSSDGAYRDRYDYEQNFSLLHTGSIEVKGGWRLYSSGPGIYLRQLIGNILGIRFCKEGLIIDPVLPIEFDGLSFTYQCYGKIYQFVYRFGEEESIYAVSNGSTVPSVTLSNPYRLGGILIAEEDLKNCGSQITIHIVG